MTCNAFKDLAKLPKCRIGIVGAGVVGGGVADILQNDQTLLAERTGVMPILSGVADINKDNALTAGVAEDLWTADYLTLVNNPEIDIIVELIGGCKVAKSVITDALKSGKAVVTANKALLAEQGRELFQLATDNNTTLAWEAAVAGGIPIILALREGLVANKIEKLVGIVNGTCNYILTCMTKDNLSYATALSEAQRHGFAEADPTFDVEGFDSGHKLALLSALAFSTWVDFPTLSISGISKIDTIDIHIAQELGYVIKLLAMAELGNTYKSTDNCCAKDNKNTDKPVLFLAVQPTLLPQAHPLAHVDGSLNAISLYANRAQEAMFYGRGAGRNPTASAVVSDIMQLAKTINCGCLGKGWNPPQVNEYEIASVDSHVTSFYLRFQVVDKPGILGKLAQVLGQHNVSLRKVQQRETPDCCSEPIPLVMLTHPTCQGNVNRALQEIVALECVKSEPVAFPLIQP